MIKLETKEGQVTIEAHGTGPELFADFMCFANAFVDSIVDNDILPRSATIRMLAEGLSHTFGYDHE